MGVPGSAIWCLKLACRANQGPLALTRTQTSPRANKLGLFLWCPCLGRMGGFFMRGACESALLSPLLPEMRCFPPLCHSARMAPLAARLPPLLLLGVHRLPTLPLLGMLLRCRRAARARQTLRWHRLTSASRVHRLRQLGQACIGDHESSLFLQDAQPPERACVHKWLVHDECRAQARTGAAHRRALRGGGVSDHNSPTLISTR